MTAYTNDAGEVVAYDTFTHLCVTCGATVSVVDGKEQPHHCRIDLDAQTGRSEQAAPVHPVRVVSAENLAAGELGGDGVDNRG